MKDLLMIVVLAALAAAPALAHVPHDNVYAVIAPESLDDSSPWIARGLGDTYRSEDGGFRWEAQAGELMYGTTLGGGVLPDGTILACSQDFFFASTDGGESFTRTPGGPFTSCDVQGSRLIASSPAGILSYPAKGPPVTINPTTVSNLRTTPSAIAGVVPDGSAVFYLLPSGVTGQISPPVEAVISSVVAVSDAGDPKVYAGTLDGQIWKYDGTWTRCGTLPPADHPNVVELSTDGTTLLAAPASWGPLVSIDDCASFLPRYIDLETSFLYGSGAFSDEEAYTTLEGNGSSIVIGGWAGLYVSYDMGITWTEAPTGPPDWSHSSVFTGTFPESPRVIAGMFGSGMNRTFDGGQTFESPNFNLPADNMTALGSPPDDESLVFGAMFPYFYRSLDGAVSWEVNEIPLATVIDIMTFDSEDIWIFGANGETPGRMAHSSDGGDSYLKTVELNELVNDPASVARFHVKGVRRYCATGTTGIACGPDPFGPWAVAEPLTGWGRSFMASWPDDDPAWIAAASDNGQIMTSLDQGATWQLTYDDPGLNFLGMVASADGMAWAFGMTGDVLRSSDGVTWDLVAELPSVPWGASPRPDYLTHPEILVSTTWGLFLLRDTGAAVEVERWHGQQRVDVQHLHFLHCDGCDQGDVVEFIGAGFNEVLRIPEGDHLHGPLRGHTLRVYGVIEGPGELVLSVDGVDMAVIGGAKTAGVELLAEVTGLEDDWHDIDIRHDSGTGVLLDIVEAHSDGELLFGFGEPSETGETGETDTEETGETGDTDTDDTEDTAPVVDTEETDSPTDTGPIDSPSDSGGGAKSCGCGPATGTAAGVWWLALGAFALRRRRGGNR
jgi:hypothetical protein